MKNSSGRGKKMAKVSFFRSVSSFYEQVLYRTPDREKKKILREYWRVSLKYNGVIAAGEGEDGNEAESDEVCRQREIIENTIDSMFEQLKDRAVIMRKEEFPGEKVDFGLLQELSSVGWVVNESEYIEIQVPFLLKEMEF